MESDIIQSLEMIAEVIEIAAQPGWVEYLAIGISLISVVISGVAIVFAVRVADKQNKIALFEKRLECYLIIRRIYMFCDSLQGRKLTNNDIMKAYKLTLGDPNEILKITNSASIFLALADVRTFQTYSACVSSGAFLFKNYDYKLAGLALIKANDIAMYITEHEIEKQGSLSKEVENLVANLLEDYEKLKKLLLTMQDQLNLLN